LVGFAFCKEKGKLFLKRFFNSQQIEPSRKHTFRNDGSQLLIYPFLEQDIGIYNCEAVNINGRNKSLNARLEVIKSYPPEIIEGPKSKNVGIGQKIIFRQANMSENIFKNK